MSLDHRADTGAQGEDAAPATPTEDESALAPAASVRSQAKTAGDSGLTTLVLWLVVLAVVVGLGLRLFAF